MSLYIAGSLIHYCTTSNCRVGEYYVYRTGSVRLVGKLYNGNFDHSSIYEQNGLVNDSDDETTPESFDDLELEDFDDDLI